MTHETEIDPTALYMAKRLSALPASIREEVIEVVAEMVDNFTTISSLLDSLAQRTSQVPGLSEEVQRMTKQYHVVMFLGMHTHYLVRTASDQYQTLAASHAGLPKGRTS